MGQASDFWKRNYMTVNLIVDNSVSYCKEVAFISEKLYLETNICSLSPKGFHKYIKKDLRYSLSNLVLHMSYTDLFISTIRLISTYQHSLLLLKLTNKA